MSKRRLVLNAIGGMRVPGCSTLLLTRHYSQRPTAWFAGANCHSNCVDSYQWERADEVPRLSDLTDLICSQMLTATLEPLRLTSFTRSVPPLTVLTEPPFFTCANQVWSGTFSLWNCAFNKLDSLQNTLSHYLAFASCAVWDDMKKERLTHGLY